MAWNKLVIDIEADDLLMPSIDYSQMPYKLKDTSQLWCISVRDYHTNQSVLLVREEWLTFLAPTHMKEYFTFIEQTDEFGNTTKVRDVGRIEYINPNGDIAETEYSKTYDPALAYQVVLKEYKRGQDYNKIPKRILSREMLQRVLANCDELIGHNIVNYDLPALMLFGMLDYRIEYPGNGQHTVFNRPSVITDTLLMSKLYNPDRTDSFGKHALSAFGLRTGNEKDDFHDFSQYTWKMGYYCNQDTSVGKDTLDYLDAEESFDVYEKAYAMEIKLIDLTVRQEVFGFDFDIDLAKSSIVELEGLLKERSDYVEPVLPPKSLNKGQQDYYTPPKIQFKKNGDPSAAIFKFANKINEVTIKEGEDDKVLGTKSDFIITKPREDDESAYDYYLVFEDREYKLPHQTPVKLTLPTTIKDNDEVKGYLLSLGWEPSEWKERDLTKDSKKQKISSDKVTKAIIKYAADTLEGPYKKHRFEYLGIKQDVDLESYLLSVYKKKPNAACKVMTTPLLRVGAEKSLCPNLERIAKKQGSNKLIKSIVEWHTYAHRKNSISGGTMDEDGEPTKGYLSFVREDGRIGTPADTVGASTYRYLHRGVANIPRGSSIYGKPMRSMFGCGEGLVQLGFDFSSLEARVEGHYILPFEGGEELAEALLAVKPNDVHSITARKLGIDRSDAKAITYAIMYGAAAAKLKKMLGLTDDEAEKMWADFWDSVAPLKALRDKLTAFWEATEKAYIPGIDGRKIRVRSQHSLINALFQSSGAILAKWSVVRVAEKLEKLGLLGDPFLHTKEDVKVWQMIVYHDECQYALHKSLIKVKSFFDPQKQTEYEEAMKAWEASVVAWNEAGAEGKEPKEPKNPFEEEAEQWMKDNPIDGLYSAIGHTDSGLHYVTLPNIVSETILESIDKTVNEHDIRVPLGIEWITGKNWYMCH